MSLHDLELPLRLELVVKNGPKMFIIMKRNIDGANKQHRH